MSPPRAERVPRGESGVATVWGLAWLAVCLAVGWVAVWATAIAATQHHLDAAADLAALSGAARLERGDDACAVAGRIAAADDATLASCRVDGSDLVVTVHGSLWLPFGLDGSMTSISRAGP